MTTTLVTFLLDRTGSMESVRDATITGFNEYLAGLKGSPDPILFTLLQFDSESLDKLCVAKPVDEVADLTHETYRPRASTPLYDAAVKAIRATEKLVEQPGKSWYPESPRVVVAIQTDGLNNASVEHDHADLAALIAAKKAAGWEFVFLGAGIDAYAASAGLGIPVANTVSYSKDAQGTQATFGATARNTRWYASGAAESMGFTRDQKLAAGDPTAQPQRPVTHRPAAAPKPPASRPTTMVEDIDLTT